MLRAICVTWGSFTRSPYLQNARNLTLVECVVTSKIRRSLIYLAPMLRTLFVPTLKPITLTPETAVGMKAFVGSGR